MLSNIETSNKSCINYFKFPAYPEKLVVYQQS